jgi:large-conductance mechanosensitive channel
MSDAQTKQAGLEQGLALTYKRLLITIVFCSIGWFMLYFGMANSYRGTGWMFLALLGAVLIPGPMLLRMFSGGGLKNAFKIEEYEVITTYGDGRKESDHGSTAATGGLVKNIFVAIIMVIVGIVATIVYIIYLSIKYVALFVQVKPKPTFINSAFLLWIVGFVVLLGVPILEGSMRMARSKREAQSDYKPAEVRKMLEETRKQLFSTSFSYSFDTTYDWNKGPLDHSDADILKTAVTVQYNNADDSTIIDIRTNKIDRYLELFKDGKADILPGKYSFKGNTLTEFVDTHEGDYSTPLTPAKADIEVVKNFVPANLFFAQLVDVEDKYLRARNSGTDTYGRIEIDETSGGPWLQLYVNQTGDTYRLITVNVRSYNFTISYK